MEEVTVSKATRQVRKGILKALDESLKDGGVVCVSRWADAGELLAQGDPRPVGAGRRMKCYEKLDAIREKSAPHGMSCASTS